MTFSQLDAKETFFLGGGVAFRKSTRAFLVWVFMKSIFPGCLKYAASLIFTHV